MSMFREASGQSEEMSPEEKLLSQVRNLFINIEDRIAEELQRSVENVNTWQSALNTNVAVLTAALDMMNKKQMVQPDEYARFTRKIDELEKGIDGLFTKFPDKDNQPPESSKGLYIQEFRNIASQIYLAAGGK